MRTSRKTLVQKSQMLVKLNHWRILQERYQESHQARGLVQVVSILVWGGFGGLGGDLDPVPMDANLEEPANVTEYS